MNQRNDVFASFVAMGDKNSAESTLFATYSIGLKSNRDA